MAGTTNKAASTRRRIVEAARRLITASGTEGLTTSDIAAEAGMSKGSVYYYFKDCGDIVRAVIVDELGEAVASFERAASLATSAHDALLRITRAYIALMGSGSPLARVVVAPYRGLDGLGEQACEIEELRGRLHRLVATQIARGKGEGRVRPEVDEDLAAAATIGALVSIASCKPELEGTEEGRSELEAQMIGFIGRGIGAGAQTAGL